MKSQPPRNPRQAQPPPVQNAPARQGQRRQASDTRRNEVGGQKEKPEDGREWIWAALLIALVLCLVFGRATTMDFVDWDDQVHVYQNPFLNPVTPAHLWHFWRHSYEHLYIPLSYAAFAALAVIAHLPPGAAPLSDTGSLLNPHVFHTANLCLHVLNTLLVFATLRLLVRRDLSAAAGALLFGLHPVQVESVAWISELRGLLCGSFAFLSIYLYMVSTIKLREGGSKSAVRLTYAAALLAGVCALLCKPSAVPLPLVLFGLDRWCLGRPARQCAFSVTPWLITSVVTVILTSHSQPVPSALQMPLWQRPFIAGDALAFYILKLLVPHDLGIVYGRTPARVLAHWWGYVTWILPVGVAILVYWYRRKLPTLIAAAIISLAWLSPVLGLAPFIFQNFSTVADRYLYLALLGPALALAYGLERVQEKAIPWPTFAVLFALAGISFIQTQTWQNQDTLIQQLARINSLPIDYRLNVDIGENYARRGMYDEAGREFMLAIPQKPDDFTAIYDLGMVFVHQGQPKAAVEQFKTVIRLNPTYMDAYVALAKELQKEGNTAAAMAEYNAALHANPRSASTYTEYGIALALQNDLPGAIKQFQAALQVDPNFGPAQADLRKALTMMQGHAP